MYYINYKPRLTLERGDIIKSKRSITVESFDYRHHAERALDEILYYDPIGEYWISTRACKNWTENE
jgi:hypothetical protein